MLRWHFWIIDCTRFKYAMQRLTWYSFWNSEIYLSNVLRLALSLLCNFILWPVLASVGQKCHLGCSQKEISCFGDFRGFALNLDRVWYRWGFLIEKNYFGVWSRKHPPKYANGGLCLCLLGRHDLLVLYLWSLFHYCLTLCLCLCWSWARYYTTL